MCGEKTVVSHLMKGNSHRKVSPHALRFLSNDFNFMF
jgi:hypothetical protein